MDPPDHTRIRRLASMAFTPRAVQRLKADVERIAATLLDDAGVGPGSGPFDVVDVLARPLPLYVICQLFAIPDIDREQFFRWSDALAQVLGPVTDPAVAERSIVAFVEFSQYFFGLAEERRAHLGDDLLSALLEPRGGRRPAVHRRAAGPLHAAVHRRPRDHGEPHRQRHAGPAARPDQVAQLRADPPASRPPSTSCSGSTRPCSSPHASPRSRSWSRAPASPSRRATS